LPPAVQEPSGLNDEALKFPTGPAGPSVAAGVPDPGLDGPFPAATAVFAMTDVGGTAGCCDVVPPADRCAAAAGVAASAIAAAVATSPLHGRDAGKRGLPLRRASLELMVPTLSPTTRPVRSLITMHCHA
jgi:hypothetical protein